MRNWLMVLSVLVATPGITAAQIPGPPPSPEDCQQAAATLAGGERNASKWYVLSSCGASGAIAIAAALRDARTDTDAEYLHGLYATAGAIRDPEILTAAADLTRDHGAAVPARVTAVLILASQVVAGFSYSPSISWNQLLASPQVCRIGAAPHGSYNSTRQLQADSVAAIAGALDQVRNDESEGQLMRGLTSCVRQNVLSWVPITVSPSAVGLTYVCGNRFRVENGSGEFIVTAFEVIGTSDRGDVPVEAWQNKYFTTRETGTVRLSYQGQLLHTTHNGGTVCP